MTDKCPRCEKWYLIYEVRAAVCTNPACGWTQYMTWKEYLESYADQGRMVVRPEELGGGLNPAWRMAIKKYA